MSEPPETTDPETCTRFLRELGSGETETERLKREERALRNRATGRPVAIIFTNYDLPEYRRQAVALGADHFLDKARDFERLPELLATLIAFDKLAKARLP